MRRMFGCSVTTLLLSLPGSHSRLYRHTRVTHTRDPTGELCDYISLFRMATRALTSELCWQLDYRIRFSPLPLFLFVLSALSSPSYPCPSIREHCFSCPLPPPLISSSRSAFSTAPLLSPSLLLRFHHFAVSNYSPSPLWGSHSLQLRVFDMLDDEVLWSRITPLEGNFPPKKSFQSHAMSRECESMRDRRNLPNIESEELTNYFFRYQMTLQLL